MISAFQTSKQALADATILMHLYTTSPIFLVTDASDTGIGATLQQRMNGIDSPLAFYSRQLRKPKLSYSAYDKELLAIYLQTLQILSQGAKLHSLYGSQAFDFCNGQNF